MYHLQKYRTKNSRHECPSCHDPHSFTYYVDDNGEPLDPTCGRCDHESRCQYHYTPAQYFQDHPVDRMAKRPFIPKMQLIPKPPQPLCTLPFQYVRRSASYNSTVILFPDVDGYSEWKEKAKELIYCKVTVSDILERNATDEERAAKIDIADWLVSQLWDRGP